MKKDSKRNDGTKDQAQIDKAKPFTVKTGIKAGPRATIIRPRSPRPVV